MAEQNLTPAEQFVEALVTHAGRYQIDLSTQAHALLRQYYELLSAWNARLHLVGPCPPAEFATRHVLESLLAVSYFPSGALVLDIGSGGGLPIIPCLIVRPDLRAVLYESSSRKAIFLREAVHRLPRGRDRAAVVSGRFEETTAPDEADVITCRALDQFHELFPQIISWAPARCTLLLFAGAALREQIEQAKLCGDALRIPGSDRRFLYVIRRSS